MMNWALKNVPEDKRIEHIIECLSDYINEVDALKEDGLPPYLSEDIIDVAELYKAIIEYLNQI